MYNYNDLGCILAGPEIKASWLPTILDYKGIIYILSSVWWWSIMVFDTHCLVLEYKGLGYIMYSAGI